jgi:molecular chaperone GrpE
MNPKSEILEPEDSIEEIDADTSPSVDEFIKELEAKEKDLDITDYKIEISGRDFDTTDIPDFIKQDLGLRDLEPVEEVKPPAEEPKEQSSGQKTRIYELEQEVESLKERVSELKAERSDIQEKSDRRLKDFESYKYRMDRERRGAFINQIGNLASQMLPVLDNLERAVDSVKEVTEEKRSEFRQFFDGVALVHQQINEVFSEMGVEPINTTGKTFDPNFHEAVATEESKELPPNTISAEMLKGYRIGNKVIRHSMVKVTTSPQSSKKEAKKQEERSTPSTAAPEPTEELSKDPSVDLTELFNEELSQELD